MDVTAWLTDRSDMRACGSDRRPLPLLLTVAAFELLRAWAPYAAELPAAAIAALAAGEVLDHLCINQGTEPSNSWLPDCAIAAGWHLPAAHAIAAAIYRWPALLGVPSGAHGALVGAIRIIRLSATIQRALVAVAPVLRDSLVIALPLLSEGATESCAPVFGSGSSSRGVCLCLQH